MTRLVAILVVVACNGGDGTLEEVEENTQVSSGDDRGEAEGRSENPERASAPIDPAPTPEFEVALRDGALLIRAHGELSLRRSVDGQPVSLGPECAQRSGCVTLVSGSELSTTGCELQAGQVLRFESCAPDGHTPHQLEARLSDAFTRAE